MKQMLYTMLDLLTGAYVRKDIQNALEDKDPVTNIGKLFDTFGYGLEIIRENADRVRLWDNLENAKGEVLDRYGLNFGVKRDGASDSFYRLMIQVKMISILSGGDIDTLIGAAASLYGVDPSGVELEEIFPAKINIYLTESDLTAEQVDNISVVEVLLKRIAAAGIRLKIYLRTFAGTAQEYFGVALHVITKTKI